MAQGTWREDTEENQVLQLQKNPKFRWPKQELNYTPKEAESLLKDYSKSGNKGIHTKNVTLNGKEGTLSVSRTHNSLLKVGGEKPKITFSPYNQALVEEQNLKATRAEFVANLPLHLAPFVAGVGVKAKNPNIVVPTSQSGNQFRLPGALPNQIPVTRKGMRDAANLARAIKQSGGQRSGILQRFAEALNHRTPFGFIPKYSSGAVVQTESGTLYRPTKGTMSSVFAYDASDAEVAYPGKGKRIGVRERIMADTPDAIAYRELVDKHQAILKDVKPTIINGQEVKVSPLSEKELITDAQKLITLKENLQIPSPKVYVHELPAFVKDGLVARITGGQASSNKPAAFQSKKGAKEREDREFRFTTEHDPHPDLFRDKEGSRRVQSRKSGANEADHLNILETTMPWTVTRDNTGAFIPRSESQMKELTELMKREYNIDLGNVNENWMMASKEAHRTGELAKHRTLASATDLQKPLLYEDADEVQLKLTDGRTLWARQDGGKYYEGDVRIKPSQIESKGNLKFQGREYEPSQMHGASLKLQDTLAAITDTKQLAESMKLFLIDSGAQEVMAGATALSSYVYDIKKDLDPLTLKIREENIPSMIKYMDTLLKIPQYKNNQVLKDLRGSFNTLWERKQEYFKLLKESYRKEGMYFRNNMNQSSIIDLNDPAMA